jgi:hypothetical protein
VLAEVERAMRSSLAAYTGWTDDDRARFRGVVATLREQARQGARRSPLVREAWTRTLDPRTQSLMSLPTEHIPFEAFRAHFSQGADRIRVALDWDRLAALVAAGRAEIREVRTEVPPYGTEVFAGFAAPWYAADGAEVGYDHPGAVPLCHAELARDLSVLEPARRARVETIRRGYVERTDGTPVEVVAATHATAGGRVLVLDGNHRLAAVAGLVDQGCPVTVREFRVVTSAVPELVPDLRHHRAVQGAGTG